MGVSGILVTANRPTLALEQVRRTSHAFDQLIIADGSDLASRADPDYFVKASRAAQTHYFHEESWSDRLMSAAMLVDQQLACLMSDDDRVCLAALGLFVLRMESEAQASLAGGPWRPSENRAGGINPSLPHTFWLEYVQNKWEYRPWLFYGLVRIGVLQYIGRVVVPASVKLANELDLRTQLSRNRLIEVSVVLGAELAGPALVGDEGIWWRNRRRTRQERLTQWEGLFELEKTLTIAEGSEQLIKWGDQLLDGLKGIETAVKGSILRPEALLVAWARDSQRANPRYPRTLWPVMRWLGKTGMLAERSL